MTLSEIKNFLNTVLNKDKSGNSLSPQEFNILLEAEIFNFVRDRFREYRSAVNQGGGDDTALTSLLIDSLTAESSPTLAGGYFAQPTDMLYMEGLQGVLNSTVRKVELISRDALNARFFNLLDKPLYLYPACVVVGSSIYVYPTNMTSLKLSYIKKPTIPVYGYYLDSNYNEVYMAEGSSHTLTTGEIGSAGQTAGTTVNSLTVETTLPEDLHLQFANYLLGKISMRDQNQLMYQAAQNEKQ